MPNKSRNLIMLFRIVALLALLLPVSLMQTSPLAKQASTVLAAPQLQAATTNTIALRVVSARTEPRAFDGLGVLKGDPVTAYKFMINVDNTGDPADDPLCYAATNPNYPDGCDWPSIRTVPGWSPIYTQGTEVDLNQDTTLDLPNGKYLISVMADGYKMDGEHFTIPMEETATGVATIEVGMHPLPLPPATMVIKVFEDVSMTNGQYDAPSEDGNPLEGFRVSLNDIAGEITADLFGNPLCTEYEKDPVTGEVLLDADGAPIILNAGQGCYSDANGLVTIPNIGPLRYDVLMFPPAGENWIQTTTLEGSQGWDTWLQEAGTGLDNEFLIAPEPFPWTIFGFVRAPDPSIPGYEPAPEGGTPSWRDPNLPLGTGTIEGVIMGAATFVPTIGGLPYIGDTFGGLGGAKLHRPIANPWLSLNDLQRGDTAVWIGQGNAEGAVSIPNLPAGNYMLTYWDENQHYILDLVQVTVNDNEVTDMGLRMLTGWFTEVSGYVFHDTNSNGKRDPGEQGVPDYVVVLRDRDNTEIDRMSIAAVTDANGFYELEKGYPMGSWMALEAYSDLHHTTGVTYQTLNMPDEVTLLDNIVDIGLLPVLGQPVRLDWGVHLYESDENGGIAGTVFYDTVRAEDEARYAGVEPWQPGIPDLPMNLYAAQTDAFGQPVLAADGSYAKGQLLATTTTETFARPKDCIPRDADGVPLTGFPVLPTLPGKDCLEGPLMGTQIGDGQNNLDGNWGFGEGCFGPGGAIAEGVCADGTAPTPLPPGNYLVEVEIPNDVSGNPMFIPTREEDLNMFDGDTFIPNIPPPACAGPLHIVDLANAGPDNMAARYNALQVSNDATGGTFTLTANGQETTGPIPYNAPAFWIEAALEGLAEISDVTVTGANPWVITFVSPVVGELTADDSGLTPLGSASTIVADISNTITVPASTPVVNPNHAAEYDAGFGRYEGDAMPLCDVKYVQLSNGKAVAPVFNLFTPVPIPGKWKGYLIDNLNVSVDPTTLFYGEMAGIPHAPIGLYDYTGRLVDTVESDYNGVYETLLPSTGTYNAPTPSGMLANVYYLYANDPGPLDAPNLNYNPQYRSIGTSFEIYPGTILPSDLAPTQNGAAIWSPGVLSSLSLCRLNEDLTAPTVPEFYAVDVPYVDGSGQFTISGIGFGATPGTVQIGNGTLPVVSWTDREIVVSVPAGTMPGAYQLTVVTAGGLSTVNGLTFHILGNVQGNRYQPNLYEVGPGRTYDPANYDGTGRGAIQHAIDDAWASGGNRSDLVVVYPGAPAPMVNSLGMYLENPILYAPVTLQGVGPGGGYPDGTPASIPGSIIDGRAVGGDSPYNLWWRETFLPDIWANRGGWDPPILDENGVPIVYEGAVITLLGEDGEFAADENATIDGFIIQGGDQQGFPNNINQVGGLPTGAAANVVVQGGGIFANGYVPFLQVSNNLIQTNGGSYGGGIRLGTPHIAGLLAPDHNDGIRIVHNRVLANGGTNLAGGIALFTGASNYEVAYNDICGNSSIEYGGGISHYGLSPGGRIHHNRIYFNSAYDEGGGVMIAGELPADPTILSPGAGAVRVHNNLIQSNMSNDDGGGLRFLMAGNFPYEVYNNMIVNNVSTHEGGGISLNDAPRVNIYNNTIMKNITTATAVTSDGTPAPAGLSSSRNSAVLQASLPPRFPVFSDPRLFNNVFWDNRAGALTPQGVIGIGDPADPNPIYYWDLGVGDGSGLLSPEYCLMQTTQGTNPGAGNLVGQDPTVVQAYDSRVRVLPWRGNPNFIGANIIVLDQPISVTGDYHLAAGSPAIDAGTDRTTAPPVVQAPSTDYDDEPRPSGPAFDMGADEVQVP